MALTRPHLTTILVTGMLVSGAFAVQASSATAAQAATSCPAGANVWTGAAHNGSWGTPGNWSQGNAPGTSSTTEDVCLPDSATPYAVTLAPFQYINNINNPPVAQLSVNSLTVGNGASLIIRGASSNGNYSSSGGDVTALQLFNGGSISAGGTLELLATDDNDGGGASDNGGRGQITGATLTNAGTFVSASQTTQGSAQSHQNELGIGLNDLPGSTATVSSGILRVDNANKIINQGTWTVAAGATMLAQYNGFTQSGATSFVNDSSYFNNGTTVMNQSDHGGIGNEESNPIIWTQQAGSVTGNPIQFTDGAELADAAGTGSFLFDHQEGQLAGTIPAGQTVTVEADSYGSNAYLNTFQLDGPQVVNQGTILLHIPNVSADNQTAIRMTGGQLTNQGTVKAVADVPNLVNELDVSVANAHGANLTVASGTLMATNGQTFTNDGMINIAPAAQLEETANQFLTGPETFTNASDGTIAPQIAGASSFGTLQLGPDSTVHLAGTVSPTLVGGYAPAAHATFAAFPISSGQTPKISGTFGAVSGGFVADYSHESAGSPYIGLVYGSAGSTGPTTGTAPKPSTLGYGKTSVMGTTVRLTLTCSPGAGCPQATVKATIRVREKGHTILGIASNKTKSSKGITVKVIVLATHGVKVGAGKSTTVSIALNATGRRLLAKFHSLRVSMTVSTSGKVRKTVTVTVTLPKPKKAGKTRAAAHLLGPAAFPAARAN